MSTPLEPVTFKRQKRAKIGVPLTAPPLWELSDYMDTEATALNQGGEYDRPAFSLEGEIHRIDESKLRFNYLQSNIAGHKNMKEFQYTSNFVNDEDESGYIIPESHIIHNISNARNGLRKIDVNVRMLMSQNKRLLGAERHARDGGYEDFSNDAKTEPAPMGITFAIDPNVPTTTLQHINDDLIAPIASYIS